MEKASQYIILTGTQTWSELKLQFTINKHQSCVCTVAQAAMNVDTEDPKKSAPRCLTCGRCTDTAVGWPEGEPRPGSRARRRAGRRRGEAGRGVRRSGHTGWGMSRGPGSADAFPARWPHKRPAAGPRASSKGKPGSMTSRPGRADRYWSKGQCGGPSLSFFRSLSTSLLLSQLGPSVHTHIHTLHGQCQNLLQRLHKKNN